MGTTKTYVKVINNIGHHTLWGMFWHLMVQKESYIYIQDTTYNATIEGELKHNFDL
jgi:hypothetical protein